MHIDCRLLVHRAAAGPWNMAVDEALAERVGNEGGCCFRLYRWVPATLSLGYFQEYSDRKSHRPSAACPVVRRPSGGGAIVHDRELTYSLIVPRYHPLGHWSSHLYQQVHLAIADALAHWQLAAELWLPENPTGCKTQQIDALSGCAAGDPARDAAPPFLCFQRRSCGDLIVGPVKVAGSAQRRYAGAVLQHGSILLARSPAAPELPGAAEVAGRQIDEDTLAELLLDALAQRLGFAWHGSQLSETEQGRAGQLVAAKYAADAWTVDRRRAGRGL